MYELWIIYQYLYDIYFFLATKKETFAFNVINSLSWKRYIRKQKYLDSRENLVFMAQRDNVGGSLG